MTFIPVLLISTVLILPAAFLPAATDAPSLPAAPARTHSDIAQSDAPSEDKPYVLVQWEWADDDSAVAPSGNAQLETEETPAL